jgi:hypothetical protein
MSEMWGSGTCRYRGGEQKRTGAFASRCSKLRKPKTWYRFAFMAEADKEW